MCGVCLEVAWSIFSTVCVCHRLKTSQTTCWFQPCSVKGVSDTELIMQPRYSRAGRAESGAELECRRTQSTIIRSQSAASMLSSHDPSADPAADLAAAASVFHSLSTSAAFNLVQVTKHYVFSCVQHHLLEKRWNNLLMWTFSFQSQD